MKSLKTDLGLFYVLNFFIESDERIFMVLFSVDCNQKITDEKDTEGVIFYAVHDIEISNF
ncbi:MAG: hypothetical protein AB8B72_02555 [Crocinitomicaceae bacterium]